MFGWLSRCWGGMGVTTSFEKARLQSTYGDWTAPDPQSLAIIIATFRGENHQTSPQAAMNSLLTNLQQDDERTNGAFLLKNLVILDFSVEERLFLTKIGNYYSSQLLYLSGQGQDLSSSVRDLIASYYVYIKEKAKLFSAQSAQLIQKKSRVTFFNNCSTSVIFNELNICFKIQTLILDVSDKFNRGNKSPQLIQHIFSNLLKTYLFCYSIVTLAIRSFIKRIPDLNRHDLEYLSRLILYINKQYTRNFLLFIERNKIIETFKQIKYNQLIILDDKVISIINDQLAHLKQQEMQESRTPSGVIKMEAFPSMKNLESLKITMNKEEAMESLVRRKSFDGLRKSSIEEQKYFQQYQNFYQEEFIIEQDPNINPIQAQTSLYHFGSAIKPIPYKDMINPKLKKQYLREDSRRFDKASWQQWPNLYSE